MFLIGCGTTSQQEISAFVCKARAQWGPRSRKDICQQRQLHFLIETCQARSVKLLIGKQLHRSKRSRTTSRTTALLMRAMVCKDILLINVVSSRLQLAPQHKGSGHQGMHPVTLRTWTFFDGRVLELSRSLSEPLANLHMSTQEGIMHKLACINLQIYSRTRCCLITPGNEYGMHGCLRGGTALHGMDCIAPSDQTILREILHHIDIVRT